jgi:hypothetical protein
MNQYAEKTSNFHKVYNDERAVSRQAGRLEIPQNIRKKAGFQRKIGANQEKETGHSGDSAYFTKTHLQL